jgi:hypothetical protein
MKSLGPALRQRNVEDADATESDSTQDDKILRRLTASGSKPGVPYVSGAIKTKHATRATTMTATEILMAGVTTALCGGRRRVVGPATETG